MKVEDIMSHKVQMISSDESAENAWKTMVAEKIHHLVVVNALEEIIGVISERDLGGRKGETIRKNKLVADMMTPNPITISPDMNIKDTINEFRGYSIGCIPVMAGKKLVGIVTLTDMLELIGKGLDRGALKSERRTEFGRPISRRTGHPPIT